MKVSRRTHLEQSPGCIIADFEADAFYEHGTLPGLVDLGEYLGALHILEKGVLDDEGYRVPVTVLTLPHRDLSLGGVEHYMKLTIKEGPFHAAWTAGHDEFRFMIAATKPEAMKALRSIYHAAQEGRAFATTMTGRFHHGLRVGAVDDVSLMGQTRHPFMQT